jgi:hypothetical protein
VRQVAVEPGSFSTDYCSCTIATVSEMSQVEITDMLSLLLM